MTSRSTDTPSPPQQAPSAHAAIYDIGVTGYRRLAARTSPRYATANNRLSRPAAHETGPARLLNHQRRNVHAGGSAHPRRHRAQSHGVRDASAASVSSPASTPQYAPRRHVAEKLGGVGRQLTFCCRCGPATVIADLNRAGDKACRVGYRGTGGVVRRNRKTTGLISRPRSGTRRLSVGETPDMMTFPRRGLGAVGHAVLLRTTTARISGSRRKSCLTIPR